MSGSEYAMLQDSMLRGCALALCSAALVLRRLRRIYARAGWGMPVWVCPCGRAQ